MKRLFVLFCTCLLAVSFSSCYKETTAEKQTPKELTLNPAAENALSYLMKEVKEIKWVDIDSNNAYIGFDPIPEDWNVIIRSAALLANKATDFGFHVWAIDASKYSKGWDPDNGSYIGEVTARKGRIE